MEYDSFVYAYPMLELMWDNYDHGLVCLWKWFGTKSKWYSVVAVTT